MEEFFTLVTNFGFPIVVAVYLLVRFEKKIESLDNSINDKDGLIAVIRDLITEIRNNKK